MSEYHTAIHKEMLKLAKLDTSYFMGQQCGAFDFYGLLKDISQDKRLELGVQEEMQLSMSIGLAIKGYFPISIFQRMDFLPRACDSLVNHLDLMSRLSRNKYIPKMIIFTTVGSTKPLDVGLQHNKNLILGFNCLLSNIRVHDMKTVQDVEDCFYIARTIAESSILVARQDLF